jgi:ABC-2 type transport system permease protein
VPRAAGWLGWALVALSTLVLVGSLLDLPQWLLDVSPLTHVPLVPVDDVRATPLLVLAAVGIAAWAVGIVALVRRDVVTGR